LFVYLLARLLLILGMQHRTEHAEQPSNVDTLVFLLQNDEGAKRWPVSEKLGEDLKTTLLC
jgi:hypothetical protein